MAAFHYHSKSPLPPRNTLVGASTTDRKEPQAPRLAPSLSEIFVHRGAGVSTTGGDSLVPENSIAACEHAVAAGLTAVEIDVWLTADLQVVVIHGAGSDAEGWLWDTVCDATNATSLSNRRIEELDYRQSKQDGALYHRRPWAKFLVASIDSGASTTDSRASSCCGTPGPSDASDCGERPLYAASEDSYRQDNCRHSDGDDDPERGSTSYSSVPLLSELLERFHGRLRFNVELKGTDPRLGPAVLEIVSRFPGSVARISSFAWNVPASVVEWARVTFPELAQTEELLTRPNGPMAGDLLAPLTGQTEVPLALLFSGPQLPPLPLVRRCAEAYGCNWVHLPYAFGLSGLEDNAYSEEEGASWLREDPELQRLLDAFPESTCLWASNVPSRRQAMREAVALRRTVRYLAQHGIRVLVYGSRAHERPERLRLVLRCGVDGLCPNDGALAVRLSKERNTQRRAGVAALDGDATTTDGGHPVAVVLTIPNTSSPSSLENGLVRLVSEA